MKELDFLPLSYREAARRRRDMRRNLCVTFGLLGALVALHAFNKSRIHSAEAALPSTSSGSNAGQSARERMVARLAEQAALERKAALLSQLDDPAPLDAAAEQIARLAGDSVSILTLRIDGGAAPSAGERGGAVNLTSLSARVLLTGVAASDVDVGIFMGKLALSPLFSHVKLSFTRETRRAGEHTREFEIRFTIRAAEAASTPGPDGSIEVNSP